MEHKPYTDKGLLEAQALVYFSLYYILDVHRTHILKYLNVSEITLNRRLLYAKRRRDKTFKNNISLMYKELENEHRRIYKKYQFTKGW